ncbi:MAG: hypothetical protein WEB31_08095 [Chthoniobacterales bacterium]
MRVILLLLATALLTACGTPYGMHGSLGGVKVWEHPQGKVEILVVGSHYANYEQLAKMWRIKAEEAAMLRGSRRYEVVSFSTGREVLGMEIMGEGSNIERYADDAPFWTPKVARGVIRVINPRVVRP